MTKYVYQNVLQTAAYHFFNGIYSGIPLCCIIFFIRKCRSTNLVAKDVTIERGEEWSKNGGVQYVQCNKCYNKKKIIKIKNNGCILGWVYFKNKSTPEYDGKIYRKQND